MGFLKGPQPPDPMETCRDSSRVFNREPARRCGRSSLVSPTKSRRGERPSWSGEPGVS